MRALYQACLGQASAIVDLTQALAAVESPSTDAAALERCAARLVDALVAAGAHVERPAGDGGTTAHVLARWPGAGPEVLILGHFDTVWPVGQLGEQPIELRDDRLYGPGVYDMKAGLAIGVTAVRELLAAVPHGRRPAVSFLATADEEVGSRSSRSLIESIARRSAAVLVLEPAMPGGAVKTARKGVGEFEVRAEGVSAHAGVDPASGASAVHEIARQTVAIASLGDPARGLTVNVGVIEGGTRSNVVAERARATIDVRVARMEDAARIERELRGLRPFDARVRLAVTGAVSRPPMERTEGVARLYALARDVAAEIGWPLEEGATGGASDGNFTAALGVPTLDGLGATGDGAHARHEHINVKELGRRAALVAGLLSRLGDNRVEE